MTVARLAVPLLLLAVAVVVEGVHHGSHHALGTNSPSAPFALCGGRLNDPHHHTMTAHTASTFWRPCGSDLACAIPAGDVESHAPLREGLEAGATPKVTTFRRVLRRATQQLRMSVHGSQRAQVRHVAAISSASRYAAPQPCLLPSVGASSCGGVEADTEPPHHIDLRVVGEGCKVGKAS